VDLNLEKLRGSLFMLLIWSSLDENHCYKGLKERSGSSSWWEGPSFVQNFRYKVDR